jgi:hypothetical protein
LLHQEHFLTAEDKASLEEIQETKQNSPKSSTHETGSLIEGESSSKEEVTEVKNMTEDQIQVAANGEIRLLCNVQHSLVCNWNDLQMVFSVCAFTLV